MPANEALIQTLIASCEAAADPERAKTQQAYMKSAMPYHGIPTPEMRRLCRIAFKAHPLAGGSDWLATAEALWWQAAFREERYAALELIGHKPYRIFFSPTLLQTLDAFIVSGAWWDYVDHIAIGFVGALLSDYPDEIRPALRDWSRDNDLWRRRSAIISQIKFKERTDWTLLTSFIEPSLEPNEIGRSFFVRKAIGWALREYSKTEPEAVIGYVREHHQQLSGLSSREALKVINRSSS